MQHSHYHNTTESTGQVLMTFEENAKTQDEAVLEYFNCYHVHYHTPDEVWKALYSGTKVPLTSIRRSFSNLKRMGKLIKTGEKRQGVYGVFVNAWRLA
jgi:hypothetical protein